MKAPTIYYVEWLLFSFRGMTIPPFGIFILKKHKLNKRLVNHELTHWKQYRKLGLILFCVRYFLQMLVFGYKNMPMEIEARHEERPHFQKEYSMFYVRPKRRIGIKRIIKRPKR